MFMQGLLELDLST